MNIEVRAPQREQTSKLQIIDCDFHPKITHDQMRPFLSNQWWSYLQTFGNRSRHGYAKGYAYPKMTPQAARRDAWPPNGGLPASDLDFVRQQHLDFYGIETAMMIRCRRPGRATRTSSFRSRSPPPRTTRSSRTGAILIRG